jgi:hypothetical protein
LIFIRFHGAFLGNQHEIWSKQHNGKVSREKDMAAENETYFCMCITPESLSDASKAALTGRKAALLNESKWSPASIISVKFLEGDPNLQRRVRDVVLEWTGPNMANLTLNFVPSGDADVRIAFKQGAGSWSYLGTLSQSIPQNQPTMNYGWLTPDSTDEDVRSVALHEFGHALGVCSTIFGSSHIST